MQRVFLGLSILGAVIPYVFFIQHFNAVGFGLGDFIKAIFVNGAASGFTADILISSSVFWIFMFNEKKVKKPWILVLVNLGIGLSCALPLYLYYRGRKS